MELAVEPLTIEPQSCEVDVDCAPGEVVVLRFPLATANDVPSPVVVKRQQFYSADLFTQIQGDNSLTTSIELPQQEMSASTSAVLRVVVEHLGPDAGQVEINGQQIPLPSCVTAENGARVLDVPISVDVLREKNQLTFSLVDVKRPAYHLICSSIFMSRS